ncbi:MAG: hypothetical protein MSC31_02955 [Solirubrobacteraceae bacterium MAG38_C4-C5]|nr:hypothetical protein [Candidatus Siliceabacter maunaloa]
MDSVPDFDDLGIVGFALAGEPVAQVATQLELAPDQALTFCEGFATGRDGRSYAWEVWTAEDRAAHSEPDDPPDPEPIARLPLLGPDRPLADVIERTDGSSFRFTQVVVHEPHFHASLLERLRTAPVHERDLYFRAVP